MTDSLDTAPAPTAVEYELFMLSGNINAELNKLGADGWEAFAFIPQPPTLEGQKVLVPCRRLARLVGAAGNGVALLT